MRLARVWPPADRGGDLPEDGLKQACVVVDTQLVRDGEQQRVCGEHRLVARELVGNLVWRPRVASAEPGVGAVEVPELVAIVASTLAEVALDVGEGADIVMVKPALPYLDVLRAVADASPVPVAAYQISGEYAMVEAAAERGWLDRERAIMETLTSIKRAGASIILTYWAAEVANLVR